MKRKHDSKKQLPWLHLSSTESMFKSGEISLKNIQKKTYLEPRLFTINDVAVKETRSGRRDRTISILCSSLHAFSHSPEETNRITLGRLKQ